jgi:hypothetical protein
VKVVKIMKNHKQRVKEEICHMKEILNTPDGMPEHLNEPAIVVDKFGRIVVWYLPSIISTSCIVSRRLGLICIY